MARASQSDRAYRALQAATDTGGGIQINGLARRTEVSFSSEPKACLSAIVLSHRSLLTAVASIVLVLCGTVAMVLTGQAEIVLKSSSKSAKVPHTGKWCAEDMSFTKTTLKSVHDASIESLLPLHDLLGENQFEASEIIRVGDYYYVICDSSWAVLRLHRSLPIISEQNQMIGVPQVGFAPGESGFEAILHDDTTSTFYVVQESVLHKHRGTYHAMITQLSMPPLSKTEEHLQQRFNYTVIETCPSEMTFDGTSKGFEGAISLRGKDGLLYILGLCEGNHCKEDDRGKDAGNGRVVVMARRQATNDFGCTWATVVTLDIPSSADFIDYSAITLHAVTQAVAITSQENSQVWIGQLEGGANGLFDPDKAKLTGDKVYDFPRNVNCDLQYCNIEGVEWISDGGEGTPQVLAAVSDKMKSKGKQKFTCKEKDQSIHLFAIP